MCDTVSGRAGAQARQRQNRTVLTRIVLKIVVLLLLCGAWQNPAEVAQHLSVLSALLSGILAFALREPWCPALLTRWDEAAFFTFASLGLRIFG